MTKSERRICHFCGDSVPAESCCQSCLDGWQARPHPASLTASERVAELESLSGPLEVPLELVCARIEALVGRPVFTHEMGSKGWPNLLREARWDGQRATIEQILELIPAEKRVVVRVPDAGQSEAR